MKVFLSTYACEPGRGSEPGVGWKWACGLASRVELIVLTRTNNRKLIEEELAKFPHDHPLHRARFVYHDLPDWVKKLKRSGLLPMIHYYFLWQWSAARALREIASSCDIIHHLTFCTTLCPGFWKTNDCALVVGPTGIPMVRSEYLPLFGSGAFVQRLRACIAMLFMKLPWPGRTLRNSAAIIPSNSESGALLKSLGLQCDEVMLDTGCPDWNRTDGKTGQQETKPSCTFLYAGVLERRKGLELSLRALANAVPKTTCKLSFVIVGDGPDRQRLETLARELGIIANVRFEGIIPHAEVMHRFADADAFVFTSVRDTSGGVNLEAMSSGLPLLCLAHQGVADITDDTCAVRIPPGPIADTINKLADGMAKLADSPKLRKSMGEASARRAKQHFSWDDKFDTMCSIYRKAARSKD